MHPLSLVPVRYSTNDPLVAAHGETRTLIAAHAWPAQPQRLPCQGRAENDSEITSKTSTWTARWRLQVCGGTWAYEFVLELSIFKTFILRQFNTPTLFIERSERYAKSIVIGRHGKTTISQSSLLKIE